MKEHFPLKTSRDVINAVLTEVTSNQSPNLAALSVLLGLLEQQLTSPAFLVQHQEVDEDEDNTNPYLLYLSNKKSKKKSHDDDEEDVESTTKETNNNVDDDIKKAVIAHDVDPTTTTTTKTTTDNKHDNNKPHEHDNRSRSRRDFDLPQVIPWSRVKSLVEQFKALIKGSLDLSTLDLTYKQEVVARVSDVIWSFLSPVTSHSHSHASGDSEVSSTSSSSSHVQFLTSFLLDKKLDSFGLTFAVLAALQVLFPKTFSSDFYLTLSEDHSWISVVNDDSSSVHGPLSRVEVTWHGKTDKRVLNSRVNIGDSGSGGHGGVKLPFGDNWLYLRGHAVVCDSLDLVVSALISSLNPSIGSNADSLPLAVIQCDILRSLHSKNFLTRYPMSLGNLADLMELTSVTHHSPEEDFIAEDLYYESISSSMTYYDSHHIYPFLYLAGYCFRTGKYGDALFAWKNASRVLSKYNYNPKEDEEAYKEFQEISTDLIPYALTQLLNSHGGLNECHYRDVVEFYDGLCAWEESSRWPVLHVVWSKSFVSSLNKFPPGIRGRVSFVVSSSTSSTTTQSMTMSFMTSHHHHHSHHHDDNNNNNDDAPTSPVADDDLLLSTTKTTSKEEDDDNNKRNNSNLRSSREIQDIVSKCSQDPVFLLKSSMTNTDQLEEEETSPALLTEIRVSSKKMSELKDLLVKPEGKLNSSAIQLQLTAQSSLFTFSKSSSASKRSHHNSSLLSVTTTSSVNAGSPSSSSTSSISPNMTITDHHNHDNNMRPRSGSNSSSSDRKRLRTSKY